MSVTIEVQHILTVGSELGEGPIWQPDEQALYWVDVYSSKVHRYDPSTGHHRAVRVNTPISALGPHASGGWVAVTANAYVAWDGASHEVQPLAEPQGLVPPMRFNDAGVDPGGRFWAGSMNAQEDPNSTDGCLYRLDPDGSVRLMDTGFSLSNGMGWSPDESTMYFTDTFRRVIYVYDYDVALGTISRRRVFVQTPPDDGYPDGLAVDQEGYVWSARYGGWKVARYDPAGRLDRELRLPVANVTSCAFGGVDFDELYITTAWEYLTPEQRRSQPLAGDLFRARVGIRGLRRHRFLG